MSTPTPTGPTPPTDGAVEPPTDVADGRTAEVRATVLRELEQLFAEEGRPAPALADDDVLLESGLDSLGFAVLVTRLEDALGRDPFTEMAEPVYPATLREFVDVYAAPGPQDAPPA